MNNQDILLHVLNIIGYQNDKLEFINKFFSIIHIETIAQLNADLTEEEKKNLEEELKNSTNEDEEEKAILKYFSKEKFDKKIFEVTRDQFTEYLERVYPTLRLEQKEELDKYLSSLPNPEEKGGE